MSNPGVTTLATVRTAARQRADMQSAGALAFIPDTELTGYVNSSYQELYDLLTQKFGSNWAVASPYTFVTDGINDKFALPADFFKLLGVDLAVNASLAQYRDVPRFNFADRNKYTPYQSPAYSGRSNLAYQILGANIWLAPLPAAGQTLRLFYVPRLTILSGDTDPLDGINGFEEYIIVDCAIKMAQKEESLETVQSLMMAKQALIARIESAAGNRDAANPQTTSVTQSNSYMDPFGYGWL